MAAALVCVLLICGSHRATRPFEGWSPALGVAAGALAAFAAWTLASAAWSDSPARALVEFDRVLLYLLRARAGREPGAHRRRGLPAVLRWVWAAIAVACVVALLTRLLPRRLPGRRTSTTSG